MRKLVSLVMLLLCFVVCLASFVSCSGKKVEPASNPEYNEKLITAVREMKARDVQKALAKGADPDASIQDGRNTVFHLALYINDTRSITQLIAGGANLNAPDKGNMSPLSLAAQRDNDEVVVLLLDNGVDVNTVNKNSIWSTALMDAADANAIATMKLLMDHGADIDILDKWKAPAITIAADKNHLDAVRLLAEAGAELDSIDTNGYTALDFAIKNKNDEMVSYLESKGAKVNKFKEKK